MGDTEYWKNEYRTCTDVAAASNRLVASDVISTCLPRDAMPARYAFVVCLSVCLSQAGTVLKRLNAGSRKQRRTIRSYLAGVATTRRGGGPLPSIPIDSIWALLFVWRIRGKIIRTALCCVVYFCAQWYAHVCCEQFLYFRMLVKLACRFRVRLFKFCLLCVLSC